MPGIRVVAFTLLLHLFAAATPLVARLDPGTAAIAFDADPDGAVVVPVFVDRAGPFKFLVDTGSSGSAISDTVAAELGLRPVARAELMSASGRVMLPVVRLGRTVVGWAARDGLLASLLRSEDLEQLTAGVQGVLGQDFLSGFDYSLDYRRGSLTWDVDPIIGNRGTRLKLTPSRGRFVVDLPQGSGRGVVRLVPDSGSATLVVFDHGAPNAIQFQRLSGYASLSGIAGRRVVQRAVIRMLRIGGVVLQNEPAVVVTNGEPDVPDADGLLPLHRFARVSFLARERCLVVAGW
jgi:predicted aspartyl protease